MKDPKYRSLTSRRISQPTSIVFDRPHIILIFEIIDSHRLSETVCLQDFISKI